MTVIELLKSKGFKNIEVDKISSRGRTGVMTVVSGNYQNKLFADFRFSESIRYYKLRDSSGKAIVSPDLKNKYPLNLSEFEKYFEYAKNLVSEIPLEEVAKEKKNIIDVLTQLGFQNIKKEPYENILGNPKYKITADYKGKLFFSINTGPGVGYFYILKTKDGKSVRAPFLKGTKMNPTGIPTNLPDFIKYFEYFKNLIENKGANVISEGKEKLIPVHTIAIVRNGNEREVTNTLPGLIKYFGYTLETGKSYEREKGNAKINLSPKNINSLVTNLNNAVNNSAANGYSSTSYKYVRTVEMSENELKSLNEAAPYTNKSDNPNIDDAKLKEIQVYLRSVVQKVAPNSKGSNIFTQASKSWYRYKIHALIRKEENQKAIKKLVNKKYPEIIVEFVDNKDIKRMIFMYGVNFKIPYSLISKDESVEKTIDTEERKIVEATIKILKSRKLIKEGENSEKVKIILNKALNSDGLDSVYSIVKELGERYGLEAHRYMVSQIMKGFESLEKNLIFENKENNYKELKKEAPSKSVVPNFSDITYLKNNKINKIIPNYEDIDFETVNKINTVYGEVTLEKFYDNRIKKLHEETDGSFSLPLVGTTDKYMLFLILDFETGNGLVICPKESYNKSKICEIILKNHDYENSESIEDF